MIQENEYYYTGQLRTYVLQFMAIFTGLQVQIGKRDNTDEQLISVPVHYGHKDRVVAAIISEFTQNKPLRLPVMSAYMRNIQMAEDMYAGIGMERRNAYVPVGGLIPNDMKVVYQRRALPYKLDMELGIMSSNTNQHFQILEQLLPLFDPQLNIQTSDSPLDMTRLTHVKLKGINTDSNYPIAQDRRIVQSTLQFEMPIYLDTPADVRQNIIQKIFMRIGAVSQGAQSSDEIIAEIDAQGVDYMKIFDGDDLTIS